ncbi:hypothetical protein [Mesorhizobium huakuii]|uniref:LysR substrate-binding domain-containing protein n=1 Tax=Mesorhizobium huakuii TaxID=28104 RepID=A0A7G6T2C0_9HYPH|nr:hypothetical protein HB778_33770 [Mesorhizobium huakuii]
MRGVGFEPNGTWHGTNFSDSDLALAAAERGQGVALGSLTLASEAIASGSLVQLFEHVLDAGRGWYAISTQDRLRDVDVRGPGIGCVDRRCPSRTSLDRQRGHAWEGCDCSSPAADAST